MDVVVTPVAGLENVWSLTDRLGRKVGKIVQSEEGRFVISAVDQGADGPLTNVDIVKPTLSAAMDEVALRLKGACQLSSNQDQ